MWRPNRSSWYTEPVSPTGLQFDRAVSPVVATILLVALVILLVSLLLAGLSELDLSMGDDAKLNKSELQSDTLRITSRGVITAIDDRATATSARHKVVFPIREGTSLDGDSLNSVAVDYLADSATTSEVSQADIRTVGIDDDGDGEIDTNVSSDLSSVQSRETGSLLYIGFGGNYGLTNGDQVVVVCDDIENPRSGVYPASVYLNGYRKLSRLGTIHIEDGKA